MALERRRSGRRSHAGGSSASLRLPLAVLTSAAVAGCAAEGDVSLLLLRADNDDPYAGVVSLRVQLLDEQLAPVYSFDAVPGAAADLGLVQAGAASRALVSGIDDGGQIRARGHSRVLSLRSGESSEELVPFSTPRMVVALPLDRAVSGAVKVDGALSEWIGPPSVVLDDAYRVSGPKKGALVLRAEVMVAWSPGRLWLAARVLDRCPALVVGEQAGSCGTTTVVDRIGFGFDGTGDGGSYGDDDFFVLVQPDRAVLRAGSSAKQQSIELAFGRLGGGAGWVVEAGVGIEALGRSGLGRGDRVGFEVSVVDETPGQSEPTVLRLSGSGVPADEYTPVDEMGLVGFAAL